LKSRHLQQFILVIIVITSATLLYKVKISNGISKSVAVVEQAQGSHVAESVLDDSPPHEKDVTTLIWQVCVCV
jgi:hypothetical protein